jgi:hypothetical protein
MASLYLWIAERPRMRAALVCLSCFVAWGFGFCRTGLWARPRPGALGGALVMPRKIWSGPALPASPEISRGGHGILPSNHPQPQRQTSSAHERGPGLPLALELIASAAAARAARGFTAYCVLSSLCSLLALAVALAACCDCLLPMSNNVHIHISMT